MRAGGTSDADITVYTDGVLVGSDVNDFQALEIPHNTSVCAKQNTWNLV